jgi:hypothetical protein
MDLVFQLPKQAFLGLEVFIERLSVVAFPGTELFRERYPAPELELTVRATRNQQREGQARQCAGPF